MDIQNRNFEIGDTVAVRDWDDMVAEYGSNGAGNICFRYCAFIDSMRFLCGRVGVVSSLENDGPHPIVTLDGVDTQGYVLTPEMLRILDRYDGKSCEQLPEIDSDQFMGFLFSE